MLLTCARYRPPDGRDTDRGLGEARGRVEPGPVNAGSAGNMSEKRLHLEVKLLNANVILALLPISPAPALHAAPGVV